MISNMNKIDEGLYLGNLDAANDTLNLKKNGINYVLTVAMGMEPVNTSSFIWKKIEILDMPGQDILRHLDAAADFIKKGIACGGILVHCFAGVSRSTSCVMAYLMREKGMSYWDALYFVRKKRPIICPNMGFVKQLQEYGNQLEKKQKMERAKSTSYKQDSHEFSQKFDAMSIRSPPPKSAFSFSKISSNNGDDHYPPAKENQVDQMEQIRPSSKRMFSQSPASSKLSSYSKMQSPEAVVEKKVEDYYCAHCKTKLFNEKDILKHVPVNSGYSAPFKKTGMNEANESCPHLFIKSKEWINDYNGNHGPIACPKKQCSVKIGNYSYSGVRCSCGKLVAPGFMIQNDRIVKV